MAANAGGEGGGSAAGNGRALWSERQGRQPVWLTAGQVRRGFADLVAGCEEGDQLQEWFGGYCVDNGDLPGRLGARVGQRLLLRMGREDLWPVSEHVEAWDEDALFDMMEYLYDHVSSGVEATGRLHDFNSCGWHFKDFTPDPARSSYRHHLNELLRRVEPGYEMSMDGQILRLATPGLAPLLENATRLVPTVQRTHVDAAIAKYRGRASTPTDRRDAVRDLADVLENLRADVKEQMSSKDEAALFEIANKFWIRHNKPTERRDYDHEAWWAWLFYVYLASIALVTHLAERPVVPQTEPLTPDPS